MLSSRDRLTRTDWNTIKKTPVKQRVYSPFGTLQVFSFQGKQGCSVVCSKKHEKSAVKRGKLRKRLYSLIRPHLKKGLVYVILPSKQAYTLDFKTLKRELYELHKKTS